MRILGVYLARIVLGALASVALIAGLVGWGYYHWATSPRVDGAKAQTRIVIEQGDSASIIAKRLAKNNIIRSEWAFRLYAELHGVKADLKAGGYALSPGQSVAEIIDHLVSGKSDEFNVVILPGLTVRDIRQSLIDDGFTPDDVDDALDADYAHPILSSRPAGQGLEGYIFPDTYRVGVDASAREIIRMSLDQMQRQLESDGLASQLAARGFTVHQAVTMASIIQKEVSNVTDQKQVAQVFEKRLNIGMMLGSDVTFMYAAKQLGVAARVDLESPYNTRKYQGLPPGPIANFNLSALSAVANPAPGEYLYFVAGDDGTTYYARTLDEHEANVAAYCHTLCS